MNYRTHKHGLALVEPMYYPYPDKDEAYNVPNQYFFGSELMVAPITKKRNPNTNLAEVEVWLPKGRWTDIYTGAIYEGDKKVTMYRGLESIPVFAKDGAIIPLSSDDRNNDCSNPKDMTIRIYRGTNTFELYEDDGETKEYKNGKFAITTFELKEYDDTLTLTVTPPENSHGLLPEKREMVIKFRDIVAEDIIITLENKPVSIELKNIIPTKNEDSEELKNQILTRVQGSNSWKNRAFKGKYPNFVAEAIGEIDNLI
jgi:alpha-glucosidase (family GH31 glycosyl hydrolase)